jgi:hypothetical protein
MIKRNEPVIDFIDRDDKRSTEETRKNIQNIYNQIYPIKEERNYILSTLGSSITGESQKVRSSLGTVPMALALNSRNGSSTFGPDPPSPQLPAWFSLELYIVTTRFKHCSTISSNDAKASRIDHEYYRPTRCFLKKQQLDCIVGAL